MMGPFGTYTSMEAAPRLAYWASINLASIIVAYLVRAAIADWLPSMSRKAQEALMPFAFSVVFTMFLKFVNHDLLNWETQFADVDDRASGVQRAGGAAILVVRRWLGFEFVTGMVQVPTLPRRWRCRTDSRRATPVSTRGWPRVQGG